VSADEVTAARLLYTRTGLRGNDRAVAVVLRIALERAASAALPDAAVVGERLSGRDLFACLRVTCGIEVARRAYALWSDLSNACHHQPLEMRRTRAEVLRWFTAAEEVLGELRREDGARGDEVQRTHPHPRRGAGR
jgi:hypothetical protein